MQPLSALDAYFLYLESGHSPMHVGGVYLIDAGQAPDDYGYTRFRAHIQSRLACSRIFRQRLVEVPYNLSHPWWINDPDFNLDDHLPRYRLPGPGGPTELAELTGKIFSEPLDRKRPLWEFAFVEGLDGFDDMQPGSWAMISKVHHAAIDGGSGAELMGALLDTSGQPRERALQDDWQPEEVPGTASMVWHAYSQLGRKALDLGKVTGEVASGIARVYGTGRTQGLEPPPMLLTAPRTIFNRKVTPKRVFRGIDFEFDRIRVIRKQVPGATVNDVILAICSGGLRTYLDGRDALPEKSLVAMTPISVRTDEQKGTMGNQVSAMLVDLETDADEPLQRLVGIMRNTRGSKLYSNALPANRITEFIPSETAALASRLYTRTQLGGRHRPFFNLIITNVPGPPVPLYLAGARISNHYGMAPVLDGLGLIIVIFSYAGRISIGLFACRDVVPDPEVLGRHIQESLQQLESELGRHGTIVSESLTESLRQPEEQAIETGQKSATKDTLARFRQASRDLERAMRELEEE